jgi:hypothetical protein
VCVCVSVCVSVCVPVSLSLCIYVCVGVSGIQKRRVAHAASYSKCRVEYLVEFDDAKLKALWEWVYEDRLSGCEGLIRALDLEEKEVRVEEVQSDELEEEEEEEEEEESEQEVEGQDGEEGDAPLEHVVKTEGTPLSSFFQPYNTYRRYNNERPQRQPHCGKETRGCKQQR